MKPTGHIRTSPADFVVEELPLYPAEGRGDHLFLRVRKVGLTTFECIRRLSRAVDVHPRDIGYAGMKDRHAITTQTLSIPWSAGRDEEQARELKLEDMEVVEAVRHPHKLRLGHLLGNRFCIVVRGLGPEAAAVEQALGEAAAAGFPNIFGPQRFGRDGDNPSWALGWLRGEHRGTRDPRQRRLLCSALQSWLFDRVVEARVEQATWRTVLAGDVVKKHDSGGLFTCSDVAADAPRALAGEISATGPIFGARMRDAEGEPGQIEQRVLHEALGSEAAERAAKLGAGTRRSLRAFAREFTCVPTPDADGLVVSFTLGKGSYATTFLAQACELRDRAAASAEAPERPAPSDDVELREDPGAI